MSNTLRKTPNLILCLFILNSSCVSWPRIEEGGKERVSPPCCWPYVVDALISSCLLSFGAYNLALSEREEPSYDKKGHKVEKANETRAALGLVSGSLYGALTGLWFVTRPTEKANAGFEKMTDALELFEASRHENNRMTAADKEEKEAAVITAADTETSDSIALLPGYFEKK